jgi:hypothetical protein
MTWKTQPATRKQVDYLIGLGVDFEPGISKTEASKLIASRVGRVNGNGRTAEKVAIARLREIVEELQREQAREREQFQEDIWVLRQNIKLSEIELDYFRIPPDLWKDLLVLVHPDHHHGGPLEEKANEATKWLLSRRTAEAGNRGARRPEGARTTRTV